MSDSELLLKAVINRIAARVSEKMIHSASEMAEIFQDIPENLKAEWSNFKKEVIEESERLENEANKANSVETKNANENSTKEEFIQRKIDHLRSKVIEINKNIEERN